MRFFRGCEIVCLVFALPLAVAAADATVLQKMRDAGVITEDEFQKFATKETVKADEPVVTPAPLPKKAYPTTTFLETRHSWTPIQFSIANPVAIPWGADWDIGGLGLGYPLVRCHDLSGIGISLVTGVDHELCGVQVGLFNVAHKGTGLQLGCINVCNDLCGVQVGLINYSAKSGVPVMPIVNIRF